MLLIPAIDLKDGHCVRLRQGDMTKDVTVFSEEPVAMARYWREQGARRLHIVDLNAARSPGVRVNEAVIRKMVKAVGDELPIQLGGGIRDLDTIERYIDDGVSYVVIGTAAVKNPGFLHDACSAFAGHVIVALDAKGGKVAIDGWSQDDRARRDRSGEEIRGLRRRGDPLYRYRPRRHDERRQHRGDGQTGAAT